MNSVTNVWARKKWEIFPLKGDLQLFDTFLFRDKNTNFSSYDTRTYLLVCLEGSDGKEVACI
jgi:hypothetical protein